MNSAHQTASFDFYGVTVEVRGVASDMADLHFLYGAFASEPKRPDLHLELSCDEWPERGFFTSLLAKDRLLKRMSIRPRDSSHGIPDETHFRDWSNVPSPLPPLFHSRLHATTATTSGAAVRMGDGRVLAIVGSNYSGKTSTAMALCSLGARLISDNMLIIDCPSGHLLRYETPLGLRRSSLLSRLDLLNAYDHRTTVSPDTGLVALLAPSILLGQPNACGGRITTLVHIEKQSSLSSQVGATPSLSWFTGNPDFDPSDVLPAQTLYVSRPDETTPHDIANLITAHAV